MLNLDSEKGLHIEKFFLNSSEYFEPAAYAIVAVIIKIDIVKNAFFIKKFYHMKFFFK